MFSKVDLTHPGWELESYISLQTLIENYTFDLPDSQSLFIKPKTVQSSEYSSSEIPHCGNTHTLKQWESVFGLRMLNNFLAVLLVHLKSSEFEKFIMCLYYYFNYGILFTMI